ncbi:MAG: endonuclease/exonuclease/phosphatase family protein [Planctomycetes bacterium]|nr:endonuclease/exonuclease/phosphatase family protein [Planctomycetota bacterium]
MADRLNNRIIINAGTYKEAFIADKPCILESSFDGAVTIGDLSAEATTTLKIATLNTHLFGDLIVSDGTWHDETRAVHIGEICAASDWDVVAFQEIWDDDLFFGYDGQPGIWPISGFPDDDHGTLLDCVGCINSGLAIMSRLNIDYFGQRFFSACDGNPCELPDCLSAKGWLEARMFKDGFHIAIFNSHTQAGNDSDEAVARLFQVVCMLLRALELRDEFPEITIVIVGDLNIRGESDEYMSYVNLFLGDYPLIEELYGIFVAAAVELAFEDRLEELAGFWDGARNVPGFDEAEHYTNSSENLLSLCFDEDTFDARLDYVITIPPQDGSATVIPVAVKVFPFRSENLTGECSEGDYDPLTSNEKSDHWAVEAELKFYRN